MTEHERLIEVLSNIDYACENERCSASACFGDFSETEDGAVEKWNRRVGSSVVNQNGKHNYSIQNSGTMTLEV